MRLVNASFLCPAAKAVCLAALLSTGTVLAGCASTEGPAPEQLAQAKPPVPAVTPDMFASAEAALNEGRPAEALEQYQRILAVDPQNGEAKLGLGEAYLALRRPDRAHEAFAAVVGRPEFRARALQGRGLAALAQGHAPEAKAALEQATAGDPTLWRAWNALATIADIEHRWSASQVAYRHALEDSPTPAVIHNNLGFSLLLQKRYGEAATEFEAALDADPHLATAQNNLRLALAWQGQYAKALAEAPPNEKPTLLNNIGYVAMMRHDYTAAQTYLSQAMADSPTYYDKAAENLQRLKDAVGAQQQATADASKR